jgi:hypothetical protein
MYFENSIIRTGGEKRQGSGDYKVPALLAL